MPIRFGMLGMWHVHADGLIKQIAAHPDEFELVAVFDPEPEVVSLRRQTWSQLFSHLKWMSSPDDVLRESLDAVIVEGRVHDNLKLAKLGLSSGRPVLLEKPAGTCFDEFRLVAELAKQKQLHLQLIY